MAFTLTDSHPVGAVLSIWTSLLVLLTLGAIFAASWVMFWMLSERSTARREWVSMREWGRERGFRVRPPAQGPLPPPLDSATQGRLTLHAHLAAKGMTLLRLESFGSALAGSLGDPEVPARLWNLLIRDVTTPWPPTGLRPVSAVASALDLFSLTSFPHLGSPERFVIYGTGSKAATALSRSAARGLLPPDVGLLLHGRHLVLDFSNRPFDTIEFERMVVVAEQLASHLPVPEAAE